jgi:hypothetical protein
MIPALASLVLAGLVAFGMLFAFFSLVPRVVANRPGIFSFTLQWLLIAVLVFPAIAVAYFAPTWLYEVPFDQVATKDQRFWLIVGGIALFVGCFLVALRSSAGKRYSQWRGGSPNTSFERTREG